MLNPSVQLKTIETVLSSTSNYSQSRWHNSEKLSKETHADYEARTWRNRLHVDKDGMVFIPQMAFKNCLAEAAKFLSVQIPGKGKATYTKHFEAGIILVDDIPLGIHKDDVEGEWLFLPSDGVRGSGKRVQKCYPLIRDWKATVKWIIADETITLDVFQYHLIQAGMFIGIGRFRPRQNGYYGRFTVEGIKEVKG